MVEELKYLSTVLYSIKVAEGNIRKTTVEEKQVNGKLERIGGGKQVISTSNMAIRSRNVMTALKRDS